MSKKIIYAVFIVLIVVSFLVGWQLGKMSETENLRKEIEVLKSNLEILYPPLPDEVYSISGKVIEIGNKIITMESSVRVSQFPLPGGTEVEKQNIEVIVTDQTEITLEPEIPTPFPEPEIPTPFPEPELLPMELEEAVSFSDIKVGDHIHVSSDENIKGKKQITATQIQIMTRFMDEPL